MDDPLPLFLAIVEHHLQKDTLDLSRPMLSRLSICSTRFPYAIPDTGNSVEKGILLSPGRLYVSLPLLTMTHADD